MTPEAKKKTGTARTAVEDALAKQIRDEGLPDPTREFRFHPRRMWRLDFAWPDLLVGCEVMGATWSGGRHVRPEGYEKDAEKANTAAVMGWLILRVTTPMIKDGRAIEAIVAAIDAREQGEEKGA